MKHERNIVAAPVKAERKPRSEPKQFRVYLILEKHVADIELRRAILKSLKDEGTC